MTDITVVFMNGRKKYFRPGGTEVPRSRVQEWLDKGQLIVVDRGLFDDEPQRYRKVEVENEDCRR